MTAETMKDLLVSLQYMGEFTEHEQYVYQILSEEFPYSDFSKQLKKIKETQQFSSACVAWVFRCLYEILTYGGSFRHLIHDIMKFGINEYQQLRNAGGEDIVNALNKASKFNAEVLE